MGEPADSTGFGGVEIAFGDELIEGGLLSRDVIVIVFKSLRTVIFLPDPASHSAKAFDGCTKIRRKKSSNLATNTGRQLAAFAGGGNAYLQGTIGVGGWETECAKVWGVKDIDGYPQPSAQA